MNVARLSIKRPIFITCIVLLIVILGIMSYRKLGLELFPDMTFPVVAVYTVYSGASPEEVDKQVTKPMEEHLATLSGVKHVNAKSSESVSLIIIEFETETDVDKAVLDVRDKVSLAETQLPDDVEDTVIYKFDPDSFPILRFALVSDLEPAELYAIADNRIKPMLEKLEGVGSVNITGGAEREIQVELDQEKLNEYQVSMLTVVGQLGKAGSNIPVGDNSMGDKQTVFRSVGEFTDLDHIRNTLVSFSGDMGQSVTIKDIGEVRDGTKDQESIGYINYFPGQSSDKSKQGEHNCIFIEIVKQSGYNTVEISDKVKHEVPKINKLLTESLGKVELIITSDQSKWIRTNVEEALQSIIIGILLAIVVVYLFLGNFRSTIITAIAIPNSLLGAMIVMYLMGYSFNIMTLMAISLTVGLLVDDAIVVRENIFRKLETGMNRFAAAEAGTNEVMLAVIASTLTIVSVFFPVGMIGGVVGMIFRPFAFTIVFAMLVSLFDGLVVAPFLSAYFAGSGKKDNNPATIAFEKFQDLCDRVYVKIMKFALAHPLMIILITFAIFASSISLLGFVKKTFSPTGDQGNFSLTIEVPAGTSLEGTREYVRKIEKKLQEKKELEYYTVKIGENSATNNAKLHVQMTAKHKIKTEDMMQEVRTFLKDQKDIEFTITQGEGGHSSAPFSIVVSGYKIEDVREGARQIAKALGGVPDLADIDDGIDQGAPEFRVKLDSAKMSDFGVLASTAGTELRYSIAGTVAGSFVDDGTEYDIRARLKPDQRNLAQTYHTAKIPNSQNRMIPLTLIADGESTTSASQINKRDKAYTVTVTANLAPKGATGSAMKLSKEIIDSKVKLPAGVSYTYGGEAESLAELMESVIIAIILAIVFVYLVLSSLYESFITPATILLAIPPALTGALLSLLVTRQMLNMMSMIGMVMLIGIVTKNSILLVDFALEGVRNGMDRKEAILQAGLKRLRPIIMTTVAMIAGMLPMALGIGQAAQMRQSMGVAVVGGLTFSTLITLIVVPATFEFIDKFRCATESKLFVSEADFMKLEAAKNTAGAPQDEPAADTPAEAAKPKSTKTRRKRALNK